METKYQYFIEDNETKEWFVNPMLFPLHRNTNDHRPDPPNWTKDPHMALSFDTRKEAIEFLSMGLTIKNNGWDFITYQIYSFVRTSDLVNRRDIPRDLIITEEFIK
jgi:hypothetical protein